MKSVLSLGLEVVSDASSVRPFNMKEAEESIPRFHWVASSTPPSDSQYPERLWIGGQ